MIAVPRLRMPSYARWQLVRNIGGLRMLMNRTLVVASALLTLLSVGDAAPATPLTVKRVASRLDKPLYVTHAPGDFGRVFILQQSGEILILDLQTETVLATPFLDLSTTVSCCVEQGLFSMAFHPDYANNGNFYVYYTNSAWDTEIARYSVLGDPATSNIADPQSGSSILVISQPALNHNGGWIGFGPNDGYLYISTGDGGYTCDPNQRAQDTTEELLGKILRIDVDNGDPYSIPPGNPFASSPGDGEIWAYGLRNPWRATFDTATGDFYIADVGATQVEEVNVQPASSAGGENYGWDCMEGNMCSTVSGCQISGCTCYAPELTLPIHQYMHSDGLAITGGEVYRGCEISDLDGAYFYADHMHHRIWSFEYDNVVQNFTERTAELAPGQGKDIQKISSFGRDAFGEIYICDLLDGEVFKIIPDTQGPAVDCNANSVEDACDIRSGTSQDIDLDGIPDECLPPVPALSRPGLAFAALVILAVGTIAVLQARRRS